MKITRFVMQSFKISEKNYERNPLEDNKNLKNKDFRINM